MKNRPECITLLITVILEKHDIQVDEVILQADDHSVEHRSVVFDVLVRDVQGNYYNVEIQNGITMWKYRMEEREHHRGG